MWPRLAAARVSAARPPPEMQTFSGRVLRRQAAAVEAVVELGDGLAQLPQAGDRRVLLIVDGDGDLVHARRRAGELAGLGLTLAEVAPVGIGGGEAALDRLGGDVDDAGARNRPERRELLTHEEADVSTSFQPWPTASAAEASTS